LRGKLIDLGKKIQSVAQILTFLIPSVEYWKSDLTINSCVWFKALKLKRYTLRKTNFQSSDVFFSKQQIYERNHIHDVSLW
jgi:hypothetical protein